MEHTNGGGTTTRAAVASQQVPASAAACAAMDPDARHRACVEFRAKLSRDTGVNLTAAQCAALLEASEGQGGEEVASLQSNPGLVYTRLGGALDDQMLAQVFPDHLKISWWCFREAAEVHKHPMGMGRLAD